jgi:preprotein translocase subunit SecB
MSYKIISKFIKDVSFEIPTVQAFAMLEKEISNYSLNFDIKSQSYRDNIIEVNTVLKMSPNENVKHKILCEITCSTLVSIEESFDNKEALEKIVLIKIPTEIYPVLYETFVYLYKQADIKNIQIDKKVDFEKLYNERKKN